MEGRREERDVGLLVEKSGGCGFERREVDLERAEKTDGGFEGEGGGVDGGEEVGREAVPEDGGFLDPCE